MPLAAEHDVYIIHSQPSAAHLRTYLAHDAEVVTIDPGRDTVLDRCKRERPWQLAQAAKQWYDNHKGEAGEQPITSIGTPSEEW